MTILALRAFEVQLWYFMYRIEDLCGQCRDTAACVSRWKKNKIVVMKKSLNIIMHNFKSTHIFLELDVAKGSRNLACDILSIFTVPQSTGYNKMYYSYLHYS
jgi:hypothetical protein